MKYGSLHTHTAWESSLEARTTKLTANHSLDFLSFSLPAKCSRLAVECFDFVSFWCIWNFSVQLDSHRLVKSELTEFKQTSVGVFFWLQNSFLLKSSGCASGRLFWGFLLNFASFSKVVVLWLHSFHSGRILRLSHDYGFLGDSMSYACCCLGRLICPENLKPYLRWSGWVFFAVSCFIGLCATPSLSSNCPKQD